MTREHDNDAVQQYNDVMLSVRLGQPLEYIRGLSLVDYTTYLAVLDADHKISVSAVRRD